jgi:hypothetical protein
VNKVYCYKGEESTMVQITLLEISEMTKFTVITDTTVGFQTLGYALRNGLLLCHRRRVPFVKGLVLQKEKGDEKCLQNFLFSSLQVTE